MTIHGSKKGSSKPRQPIIAPDSAQSKTYINILYGLGEGEIAGLADGYKSVYLDDTPLQNDNGEFNFPNVKVDFRAGTNDQTYIDGFPDVSSETAINVELKHGTPWVKSFNNLDLDALRIRLKWGALRSQNTDNGDVSGVKIDYAIDIKTDNGGWVQALATSINAKTSSNYERSHRIDLPTATQGWQVRVRRITPNSTSDFVSDKMYVSAITEVIDLKLRYPNTALLGLRYDAESFSNVAKMSARCRGLIIKVPTNYDPVARTYDGLWDGTFKRAYTNNPAWVYYDLCTAERYGLGERLTPDMIDKWSLYRLAQYCDEMVDDGMGGQEPRFTVNVYIQSAEGAFEVLSKLAGVFRAISYWDGNSIVVDADIPQDSMYSFSRANVIDGVFEYSGTRARDRHTVAKVAWSNPANHFKTEYEYVRDEKAIAKFGVRVADIQAWGCTSKGQAQRAGLWALKSEQLETRMVTFKVGLDGYIPTPAKVIEISDELFAGRANGGRVLAINTKKTVITLDRPITAKAGDTLVINGDDGISQRRQIKLVNGDKITVTKAFTNISVENVWVLDSADLATMKFRVLSVTADDNHQFTITAVQYNPAKYDAIDTGAYIDERPISVINPTVQAPTKSVNLSSYHSVNQGVTVTTLVISWEQVTGAVKYAVEWRKDNSNWQALPATGTNSIEISGVYAGQYEAKVTAISAFGQASLATHSNLTEIQGKTGRPTKLAKLTVQGVLFGMELSWLFGVKSEDTNFTEIQVSPDGRSNIATLGTFAYPTDKHTINGLQGNLTQYYRARIVDKLGNVSDWTAWTSGTTEAQADKVLNLLQGQITASQLHQDLSTPIGKIGTLETGLNLIAPKVTSLESSIVTVNSNLANLNANMTAAKADIAKAKTDLSTAIGNITTERNRITSAIHDITALQSANTAKTQEIANLTQTVGSHTSSIRELGVTTGDLAQKYNQIKTQVDKSTSDITQIKQTQNGQATSIERLGARFDNLSVGGRNYLLNSDFAITKHDGENLRSQSLAMSNAIKTIATPCTLTVSAHFTLRNVSELANDVRMLFLVRFTHADGTITAKTLSYNAKTRMDIDKRLSVEVTIAKPITGFAHTYIDVYGITAEMASIARPQIELGTIPTDWSPAPEDIDAQFVQTNANINTLQQTVTSADTALSQRIDTLDTSYKRADTALNASITAEQQARTNADNALSQRITAMDSAYKSADTQANAKIATLGQSLTDKGIAMSRRVDTLQASYNTLNSSKASTASVTAETQARTTADAALSQRIDSLSSDYQGNKASVASQLQTLSNASTATAERLDTMSSRFDSLSVGGRNLLLNTQNPTNAQRPRFKTTNAGTWRGNLSFDGGVTRMTRNVTSGELLYRLVVPSTTNMFELEFGTYTFSGKVRTNSTNLIIQTSYHNGTRWNDTSTGNIASENWTEFKVTITIPDTARGWYVGIREVSAVIGNWFEFKELKLEKGNIATDYTPAPEDIQSQLNAKASTATLNEFKQTSANADTALGERITALDTAYKKSDTDITARLTREESTRASGDNANAQALRTLESTVNGIGGRIGTSESKIATLERTTSNLNGALATAQNQLNARFDNLTVGGRNLILKSDVSYSGYHSGSHLAMTVSNDVAGASTLTLSADIEIEGNPNVTYALANRAGVSTRIVYTDGSTQWFEIWQSAENYKGRMVRTLNVPSGKTIAGVNVCNIQTRLQANKVIVGRPKLEKGNIATDWTPAPEDVQSQLDAKASTASLNEYKQAQAAKDNATTQRITALDTAYKSADRTLTANLASETTARTNADNALTQRIDSLQTDYNGNKASVANQLKTLSDKDTATAQKLTQFESNLGQKANATALNDLSTRVTQVDGKITAEVQKISTLQTTIGRHTASIEQHTKSLHGLSAQWTLKVQSGNIVSGIGLASSNGVSDFAVRANKFYIAPPTGTTKTPLFSVVTTPTTLNGVTVPVGNYLSDAFIKNGSITNAKIANAAITSAKIATAQIGTAHIANGAIDTAKIRDGVITTAKIGIAQIDTLQIAGEAVTVPRAQSFDNHRSGLSGQIFSLSMNAMGGSVLVSTSFLVDCTNTVSTRSSGHAKAIATINKKLKLVIKCNGSVISERMFTFRDEREKEVSDNSNSGNRPVTATATAFVYDKMVSIINHVHRNPPANAVYTVELHDSGGEGSYVVTNGSVLLLGIKR